MSKRIHWRRGVPYEDRCQIAGCTVPVCQLSPVWEPSGHPRRPRSHNDSTLASSGAHSAE